MQPVHCPIRSALTWRTFHSADSDVCYFMYNNKLQNVHT